MTSSRIGSLAALLFAATLTTPAHAIIVYPGTGDTALRNTTAPTGTLAGSGWQFEGKLFSGDSNGNLSTPYVYAATVVGPDTIIAARHTLGDKFEYNGVIYNLDQVYFPDTSLGEADSDLSIYRVHTDATHPAFSSFAPIYGGSNAVGQDAVLFGRGADPGAAVMANGQLKGFLWGDNTAANFDHSLSWGQNTVNGIVPDDTDPKVEYLTFAFDRNGLPNEGALSGGDSGGGLFINIHGTWMLAGVNAGVVYDSFATSQSGPFQRGSMLDQGGLWRLTPPDYTSSEFVTDTTTDIPVEGYATRLGANAAFLGRVLGISVPEPSSLVITGSGVLLLATLARFRRRKSQS